MALCITARTKWPTVLPHARCRIGKVSSQPRRTRMIIACPICHLGCRAWCLPDGKAKGNSFSDKCQLRSTPRLNPDAGGLTITDIGQGSGFLNRLGLLRPQTSTKLQIRFMHIVFRRLSTGYRRQFTPNANGRPLARRGGTVKRCCTVHTFDCYA
jgi:hypothetical protein